MADTNQQKIINDNTLIAIYDNIPYIWKNNAWEEIEILNTGVDND